MAVVTGTLSRLDTCALVQSAYSLPHAWEVGTVKVEEAKNEIAAVGLFMRGFGSELIEVVKLFHYSNCT